VLSKKIGIDLGTSTVLIHVKGEGILFNEPSLVAINQERTKIVAIGARALDQKPKRGYTKLYVERVTQADKGCDFDFLTGTD